MSNSSRHFVNQSRDALNHFQFLATIAEHHGVKPKPAIFAVGIERFNDRLFGLDDYLVSGGQFQIGGWSSLLSSNDGLL